MGRLSRPIGLRVVGFELPGLPSAPTRWTLESSSVRNNHVVTLKRIAGTLG